MITNIEIADVLDKAAGMYESEQVEWCQRAYTRVSSEGKLSACAAQSLLMACGATVFWRTPRSVARVFDGLNKELYAATLGILPMSDVSSKGLEGAYPLIEWNDEVLGRTKQDVIDLFKNTAKELRNS